MVAHTAVWNQKCVAGSKSGVPKEVPIRRYIKVIGHSIPPQHAVGDQSVPPTQWIDNIKIKITSKQTILRKKPFSVAHESMVVNRSKDPDVWTIHSPNALVKKLEAAIPKNLLWYWRVQCREVHLGMVEFRGRKEAYKLLEVSTDSISDSRWNGKVYLPCNGVRWTLEPLGNKVRRESSDTCVQEYPQLLFHSYTMPWIPDTILPQDTCEHRKDFKRHTKIDLDVLGMSCQQL